MTDPEQARVLTDPAHLRFVAPFLARARTVGDVATELGAPLSTVYRRVQRYLALGILEVTRLQARKGKPLKVYRTVADAFFVPYRATDREDGMRRWEAHWAEDFRRGLRFAFADALDHWGDRISRKDGVFTSSLASGPDEEVDPLRDDMPALYSRFHDSLYLDFAQAKSLQRELDALFQRYARERGRQRYMLRFTVVPVSEDAEVIP